MVKRVLILATVLALFVLPAGGALADSENPFQGHWVGGDVLDGSINTLTVGGGKNHARYQEDLLTACDEFTGQPLRGSLSGLATIEGDTLTFSGILYCVVPGEGLRPATKPPFNGEPFELTFTNNGNDTLQSGSCYHRPSEPSCP